MKSSVTVRFTSGREEKFEMQFWGGAWKLPTSFAPITRRSGSDRR